MYVQVNKIGLESTAAGSRHTLVVELRKPQPEVFVRRNSPDLNSERNLVPTVRQARCHIVLVSTRQVCYSDALLSPLPRLETFGRL